VASIEAQLTAVLLPGEFHLRACGRFCIGLRPAPVGSLTVSLVGADGGCASAAAREVGAFGAYRRDNEHWLVALATADGTWFHGEYHDTRVLRQRRGTPPEPLRSVLTAELIVLQ
jgi:hypothetical protein